MDILSKISRLLREMPQPVITDYQLHVEVFHLILNAKLHVSDIKMPLRVPSKTNIYHRVIEPLIQREIIASHGDFPAGRVFEIVGNKPNDVADIVCSVDPFSYVSHLSAMEYHGFTNRFPKILFISTPGGKDWKAFAKEKMRRDCGDSLTEYIQRDLPQLVRVGFSGVTGTKINRFSSVHLGAFKHIEGRKFRVSTIGRTFLDMLRKPDFCGGMKHVMDVYSEHGDHYRRLIIDEVDRHGKAIEKARAGYLLEDLCHVSDPKIDEWAKHVQRGGSRKLDPDRPYKETYSERWCISLNTD